MIGKNLGYHLKAILLATTVISGAAALAQGTFPQRAVKIVVPFAPGGSSDSTARIVAEQLAVKWKQPVIIDNKPGAAAGIGSAMVAKAPADGYTILLTTVSIGTVQIFQKNPGFNPIKDLVPVGLVAEGDYVLLANKTLPAANFNEFSNYVKKTKTKIFHGAFGGGAQLAFLQLAEQMNWSAENVLYRGEAPALTALMGDEVQTVFATLSAAKPFVDSGRLKAIGIASKAKSLISPEIPTLDEGGAKGFVVNFWFGFSVPTGTPETVIRRVNEDLKEVLGRADVKSKLLAIGLVAKASTPVEFGKMIKYESERWNETAKRAGIEAQ